MPNLTQIEKSKKASFKHFNRLFTHLKKTLSRKSLNNNKNNAEIIESIKINEEFSSINNNNNNDGGNKSEHQFENNSAFEEEDVKINYPIKNVILRRMHSNKRIYEKLRTKR